uniref:(northern house mosquito) hypothetical protein n=1 Tax=Culex pipiens TaxID=7175 RepID=A0A8D8CF00_CULPI
MLPSRCSSLAVACSNQPGSWSLFSSAIETLFMCTAMNCANFRIIGWTFFSRKSRIRRPAAADESEPPPAGVPGAVPVPVPNGPLPPEAFWFCEAVGEGGCC